MAKQDKKIQDLQELVEKKRAEIESAERPNWKTHMSFSFNPSESSGSRLNLHVVVDINILTAIAGFLHAKAEEHRLGTIMLGMDPTEFTWMGFNMSDWTNDLTNRAVKIQLVKKKQQLAKAESILESLLSPEAKAKKQLADVEEFLNKS